MSRETMEHLNRFVLVGMTDTYKNAWHFDIELQEKEGWESNHYPGPIPFEDLEKRLFFWTPIEAELHAILPDGTEIVDKERKVIVRPDIEAIFGIFKSGYQIHGYLEWLHDNISEVFDEKALPCSSAGLLKLGAMAWIQLETPESISTPEGVEFRPHILCSTSLDGSLATTYAMTKTVTVCDNTYEYAMRNAGGQLKLKHTRYSHLKVQDTMDALQLVYESNEDFEKEISELCNTTVSDGDWEKFLNEINPIPADEGRGKTVAQSKRSILTSMYENDERVKPWAGTAWGVVQCISTFSQHENGVHGEDENPNARNERNMIKAIKGDTGKVDKETIDTLQAILA